MRILIVHNRYQLRGGEDGVVQAESELLRRKGHEVEFLEEDNDGIVSRTSAVQTALRCVYSVASARQLREHLESFRPDLVHIHNFFPRLSPSIHYVCHRAQIPLVQTLHNYRLLCPGSILLREEKACEDCIGRAFPWPAVRHGCYRKSRAASAAVANMLFVHRLCATWNRTVSRFIALTEFARQKFCDGGLPAEKISVKPNFVIADPGMGRGKGGYALFVGRLSLEKGVECLLKAWEQLKPKWKLKIVGDGPLESLVKQATVKNPSIEWLGWRSKQEVYRLMADADVLFFPSLWYEGFPLVLAEAFATGLPIVASRLGAIAELVDDGRTGRLFSAGDSHALAVAAGRLLSNPDQLNRMRHHARSEFEEKYTAESNYAMLLDIYRSALESKSIRGDL